MSVIIISVENLMASVVGCVFRNKYYKFARSTYERFYSIYINHIICNSLVTSQRNTYIFYLIVNRIRDYPDDGNGCIRTILSSIDAGMKFTGVASSSANLKLL